MKAVCIGISMYWNSGCGAAELIFYSEGERTSLELIFERQAGFYILFKDEDGKRFMAKSQGIGSPPT